VTCTRLVTAQKITIWTTAWGLTIFAGGRYSFWLFGIGSCLSNSDSAAADSWASFGVVHDVSLASSWVWWRVSTRRLVVLVRILLGTRGNDAHSKLLRTFAQAFSLLPWGMGVRGRVVQVSICKCRMKRYGWTSERRDARLRATRGEAVGGKMSRLPMPWKNWLSG